MSSSSDEDVFSLLPNTGAATKAASVPSARPKRSMNFAAMINDTDSDDDIKHKPKPVPKAAAQAKAAKPQAAAPPSSSDSSDDETGSIEFAAEPLATNRSPSASTATEINFSIEPKKEEPKKVQISPKTTSAAASIETKSAMSNVAAPVAAAAATQPTPYVAAAPIQNISSPVVAPTASVDQPKTFDQTKAYSPIPIPSPHLEEPHVTLRPPITYQAPQPDSVINRQQVATPVRSREVRMDSNVDELLARAQQRLRERQYNTQPAARGPSPSAAARFGTPTGMHLASPTAARNSSVGRASTPSKPFGPPPLLPPDFGKDGRAQKENQRLSDEVTFLTAENHRLRSNSSGAMANASSVEITKLELQLEVAKKQNRETDIEAQRTRRLLEEQLRDVSEHRNSLQEEIAACLKSVAQFEQMSRDKDAQLSQEQSMCNRLKSDLGEAQQDLARHRDDLNRQSIEWSAKLDRNLSLLEDLKRQRSLLTDLNDKVTRDKDAAVAERKKLFDDLRQCVSERNREKDASLEEINALKRDVERYRSMQQEKERLLGAQMLEERKAKEALQAKLLELEGAANKGAKSLEIQLRSQQDEHRHVAQRLQDQLHQAAADLRHARQEAEELRSMLGNRTEKERFEIQQEYNDHVFNLRKDLDDTLVNLRNAEAARDLAIRECERYKEELRGASSVVSQWKGAKDKIEAQNHQLTTTIALLMDSDDGHATDREKLKAQIEAQEAEIQQLQLEVDQSYEMEHRFKDLLDENDRLSSECSRVTKERDDLVDENGKMATEVLKWRDEVKDMLLKNKVAYSNKVGPYNGYAAGSR